MASRVLQQQTQAFLQSVGQSGEFGSTRAEVLRCCLQLLRTFQECGDVMVGDAGPSSHTLLVAKAGLELVVRWGICPHLSPGVGIPLPKRSSTKGAASLAAAVTEHLGGGKVEVERFFSDAAMQELGGHKELLAESAEALLRIARQEGPLGQLVTSHHVADLFAAFLQLGYGQEAPGEDGRRRLDEMVDGMPVAHAVEALMILLAHKEPAPPGWFNQQAGKLLSRLVLREGGVGAVLERLVGEAEHGDVTAFRRAAVHLARCPESVTTREDYYRSVCPQLLQLFLLSSALLPHKSEAAVRSVANMQQTSVMLACLMFKQEPKLAEEQMLRPLVRDLVIWAASHSGKEEGGRGAEGITEASLLNSLWQVHALVTAGHEGSKLLRPILFRLMQPVAPLLLSLHALLEPRAPSQRNGDDRPTLQSGEEESHPLDRIPGVLDDIVVAIVGLPVKRALPAVAAYLLEPPYRDIRWPDEKTSIGHRLQVGRMQCEDPAMHVVKLIGGCKNWKLAVSLMEHLLLKLVEFRHTQIVSESDLSKLEQVFEVISDKIGSTALEEDLLGSLSIVKNLLSKNEVLEDEEMKVLVLYMLGSSLTSLRRISESGNETQMASYLQVLHKIEPLLSITEGPSVHPGPGLKNMTTSLSATLQSILKTT